MRKEVLIAIFLGFVLGLVITFGIWTANKALKQNESASKSQGEEALPNEGAQATTSPAPVALSLAILSPEDESLQEKEKVIVSGSTEPAATVAVISEKDEKIVEADETGRFDAEVTLENGTNEIVVVATDQDGNEVTKTVNVVYSTSSSQ